MIAIIDYGMGNLGSVRKKMDRLGVESIITSEAEEIKKSEKIILPGVGHFAKAVNEIKSRGLWDLLSGQVLVEKKPILGICLGMQLMAAYSEEGNAEGFGWFDSEVIRFKVTDTIKYKIPHMGWNSLEQKKVSLLLNGLSTESQYYFVHSYHVKCNDPDDILATTTYETKFVSAIQKGNIFGTQFHPEKSHGTGEMLLRNFINM